MPFLKLCFCYFVAFFILTSGDDETSKTGVECTKLLKGQFLCPDPKYDFIDPKTQQPRGCTQNNLASGKNSGKTVKAYIPILLKSRYYHL